MEKIKKTYGLNKNLHKKVMKIVYEDLEETEMPLDRRTFEKQLLDHIGIGNVTLSKNYLEYMIENEELDGYIGYLSSNTLQQAQFSVVASIVLFCRTAIDVGLPENISYTIQDIYIQHLGKMNDSEMVYQVFIQAFLEYCECIQDYRLSTCSPPLKKCCEYIFSHLQTKITMQNLSDVCELSPNYVSYLFFKELRMRPMNYIQKEKLKYASYLLKNTKMSVTYISELLCFPSGSAFSTQFYKMYGITPLKYRNENYGD